MTPVATTAPPDAKEPLSLVTYYRCTLTLPILLPAVLAVFYTRIQDAGWLGAIAFLLMVGGFMAGVPYLVLAAILFFAARNRTGRALRWLALAAPVMLLPLYVVWTVAIGVATEPPGSRPPLIDDPSFYLIVLVFAYGYVAVIELMRLVGERMGWLRDMVAQRC
jgi:hypothetical protein